MSRARLIRVAATVCLGLGLGFGSLFSACDGDDGGVVADVSCEPACAGDEVCSVDGVCVAVAVTCDPACEGDAVCSADGECVTLTVTCEPACLTDEVCSSDGMCVVIDPVDVPTCEPACDDEQVCTTEGACVAVAVTCEPACDADQERTHGRSYSPVPDACTMDGPDAASGGAPSWEGPWSCMFALTR